MVSIGTDGERMTWMGGGANMSTFCIDTLYFCSCSRICWYGSTD